MMSLMSIGSTISHTFDPFRVHTLQLYVQNDFFNGQRMELMGPRCHGIYQAKEIFTLSLPFANQITW